MNVFFEYMVISLTQTYSLKDFKQINELKDLLLKRKNEEDVMDRVMSCVNESKKGYENEIEMELSDVNYLRRFLEKGDY